MDWFFGKSDIPSPPDTPKLPPEQDATNKKVKTNSIQTHRDAINNLNNPNKYGSGGKKSKKSKSKKYRRYKTKRRR